MDEKVYTITEAAQLLGLSYQKVHNLALAGALRTTRRDGQLLVSSTALERFRESQAIARGISCAHVVASEYVDLAQTVSRYHRARVECAVALRCLNGDAAEADAAADDVRARTARELAQILPFGEYAWDGRAWRVDYDPTVLEALTSPTPPAAA
jgi:excisionase family DNA binding protein